MKEEQPAFPLITSGGAINDGMTLRQWYAGMALSGMMANPNGQAYENSVRESFFVADLMIAESNKPT